MNNKPSTTQLQKLQHELQICSTALSQYKADVNQAELENELLRLGFEQLIKKYTKRASGSSVSCQLLCSNVVEDVKIILQTVDKPVTELLTPPQPSANRPPDHFIEY